jgi:RNA polymerase sigma-70 factor, ECF subfamily
MPEPSDQALIKETLAGNAESFRRIMDRYQARVLNLAYRFMGNRSDAEDAAQEAFAKAYFNLSRFREGADLLPWLYKITTNVCFTMLKKRRPASSLDGEESPHEIPAPGAGGMAEVDERDSLLSALQGIPPKYRIVVLLYYAQDLSYQQIASVCDLPLNTVRTHLRRGKELLKRRLEEAEYGRQNGYG